MESAFFDNKTNIVNDDLVARLKKGDCASMASAVLSIYGFRELAAYGEDE